MSHEDTKDSKENILCSQENASGSNEDDLNLVTIQCPILQNCDEFVKVSELESHCIKHHKQFVYYDKFYTTVAFGYSCISLLVKNQVPFLIYCSVFSDDCWFSAFHFNSPKKNLQYNISLSQIGTSTFSSTQSVLPFDESIHCPRCIFGRCALKFHKHSRVYGNTSSRFKDVMNPSVSLDVLQELGNRIFACTIDVFGVDDLFNIEAKFLYCDNNHKLIKEVLQCNFCYYYMSSIRLCPNGHTICTTCKGKHVECYCKAEFGELRCYSLEEISNKFQLPCQNEGNGCSFIGNAARMNIHEDNCYYKLNRCT